MCCRVCILTNQEEIELYFKKQIFGNITLPNYNLSPTQTLPILIFNKENISIARWGIKSKSHFIFNSRIETLVSQNKANFYKCLIITSGFYEWQKINQTKIPYFIKTKDENYTLLAGVYIQSENQYFCSIITQNSNEDFSPIHNRVPLIINPKDIDIWLNKLNIEISYLELIKNNKIYSDIEIRKVSTKVNNSKYNKPDIFEIDYYQDSLF